MLNHLMASSPPRRGFNGVTGTTLSCALHVAIVWGAHVATRHAVPPDVVRAPDTTVIYVENRPGDPDPTLPSLPRGNIVVPDVRPSVIPLFFITDFPAVDPLAGNAWTLGVNLVALDSYDVDPGDVIPETAADEPPELVSRFSPPYPSLLRQAGIEGTIEIEVVIDTTGRPERGSIRVTHSSSRAFEQPAVEAVMKSIYRPGRVRGQPVRVLVHVPITFSIRR